MRRVRMNVRTKIFLGNLLPIGLMVILAYFSYLSLQSLLTSISAVDDAHGVIEKAQNIRQAAVDMGFTLRGYLLTGEDSFLKEYESRSASVREASDALKGSLRDPSQIQMLNELQSAVEDWIAKAIMPAIDVRRLLKGSESESQMKAIIGINFDRQYVERFQELISKFIEAEKQRLMAGKNDSNASAEASGRVVFVGSLIVIGLSCVISFVISGRITRPLLEAVDFAGSAAEGDLSKRLQVKSRDEIGRLSQLLNEMIANLSVYTKQVLQGASVLSSSAAEIAATIGQLAASTSKTSAAITQTTATVEEVRQAARVSGEQASKVVESAGRTAQISDTGKTATEETIQRINDIQSNMENISSTVVRLNEHSQAIENIVDSVQDIADQSHLLAVNASIEAARAGEQGKGFAVVAQEIKSLADQSKAATDQIRSILDETKRWINAVVMSAEQGTNAVLAGVSQSGQAGESIALLTRSVVEASQAAQVIHSSIEQQFAGVNQVSQAMVGIEQAVQQNLTGISQLESAARGLEELSSSLRELATRFTT
ncbi:MAG: methyl-accepting chemotaxis protein [Desulfomonile tiedjei]|nr:methyl-accepting chemotaxis protein [Desulfomonile tiedjei]